MAAWQNAMWSFLFAFVGLSLIGAWKSNEKHTAALDRIAAALERQIPVCELTDFVPPETAEPLPVRKK